MKRISYKFNTILTIHLKILPGGNMHQARETLEQNLNANE